VKLYEDYISCDAIYVSSISDCIATTESIEWIRKDLKRIKQHYQHYAVADNLRAHANELNQQLKEDEKLIRSNFIPARFSWVKRKWWIAKQIQRRQVISNQFNEIQTSIYNCLVRLMSGMLAQPLFVVNSISTHVNSTALEAAELTQYLFHHQSQVDDLMNQLLDRLCQNESIPTRCEGVTAAVLATAFDQQLSTALQQQLVVLDQHHQMRNQQAINSLVQQIEDQIRGQGQWDQEFESESQRFGQFNILGRASAGANATSEIKFNLQKFGDQLEEKSSGLLSVVQCFLEQHEPLSLQLPAVIASASDSTPSATSSSSNSFSSSFHSSSSVAFDRYRYIFSEYTMNDLDMNQDDADTVLGQGTGGVVFQGKLKRVSQSGNAKWVDIAFKEFELPRAQLRRLAKAIASIRSSSSTSPTTPSQIEHPEDKKTRELLRKFRREAKLMWLLNSHPNCAKLYGLCLSSQQIGLVMEYCNLQSLDKLLYSKAFEPIADVDSLTRAEQISAVTQIISGLFYLHSKGIVHRDIKSPNVLVHNCASSSSDARVLVFKLTDFGSAKVMKDQISTSRDVTMASVKDSTGGTLRWQAIEVDAANEKPKDPKCKAIMKNPAVDVYSLGLLITEIFLKQRPFASYPSSSGVQRARIELKQAYDYSELNAISTTLFDLVQLCISPKPEDRPTMFTIQWVEWPKVLTSLQAQRAVLPILDNHNYNTDNGTSDSNFFINLAIAPGKSTSTHSKLPVDANHDTLIRVNLSDTLSPPSYLSSISPDSSSPFSLHSSSSSLSSSVAALAATQAVPPPPISLHRLSGATIQNFQQALSYNPHQINAHAIGPEHLVRFMFAYLEQNYKINNSILIAHRAWLTQDLVDAARQLEQNRTYLLSLHRLNLPFSFSHPLIIELSLPFLYRLGSKLFGLAFQTDVRGEHLLLSPPDFRDIFCARPRATLPRLVVLNTPHSFHLAKILFEAGIQYVICTKPDSRISDSASHEFNRMFWQCMASGRTIEEACELGNRAIRIMHGPDSAQKMLMCTPTFNSWNSNGTRKRAIVIGVDAYESFPLQSPIHDAEEMSKTLKSIGFDVITVVGQAGTHIDRLQSSIEQWIFSLNPSDIALFYFSGHGCEVDGRNYLLPSNNQDLIGNSTLLCRKAIDLLADVLLPMLAHYVRCGLILLDCCRLNQVLSPSHNQQVGLSPIQFEHGQAVGSILLAYACAPGCVSTDGGSASTSLFTKHLLRHLPTPNTDLDSIMIHVTKDVIEESNNEQRPYQNKSYLEQIFLNQLALLPIASSDLEYHELIGEGGFGDVYRGRWITRNKIVAIKRIRVGNGALDSNAKEEFLRELRVHTKLSHSEHILTLHGACLEPGHYALVLEYMADGNLSAALKAEKIKSWEEKWSIAKQVIQSIHYLHSLDPPLLHRDIKSSNFLLKQEDGKLKVKVSDFGLSKVREHTVSYSSKGGITGTLRYMAPEKLKLGSSYTLACDIYSLSIVLWEIATGEFPFGEETDAVVGYAVQQGERLSIPEDVPREYKEIIEACWKHEPKQRITAAQAWRKAIDAFPGNEKSNENQSVPSPSSVSFSSSSSSSSSFSNVRR